MSNFSSSQGSLTISCIPSASYIPQEFPSNQKIFEILQVTTLSQAKQVETNAFGQWLILTGYFLTDPHFLNHM
jgi:hypothetical protein